MANSQISDYADALKEWNIEPLTDMCLRNNVGLGTIPVEHFEGNPVKVPLMVSFPPGVSADFTQAQTIAKENGSEFEAWSPTHKELFGHAFIPTSVALASMSKKGAFIQLLDSEREGIVAHVAKFLEHSLYRDGSGVIGQVESIGATFVVLTKEQDCWMFTRGLQLVAAATKTGALRTAGTAGTNRTTTFNIDERKVFFNADPADGTVGISSALAVGDYLIPKGNAAAGSTKKLFDGFEAWLPGASTVDSSPFNGVTRTGSTQRLGQYLDAATLGLSYRDALIRMDQLINVAEGSMDIVYLNPEDYVNLMIELISDGVYTDRVFQSSQSVNITFKAITQTGMNGQEIKILPARFCQVGILWCMDERCGVFGNLWDGTDLVHVDNLDNLDILRASSSDGLEVRSSARLFYCNRAPGWCGKITMPNAA